MPVTTTLIPPFVDPLFGETFVTAGTGAQANVSPGGAAALVPRGV